MARAEVHFGAQDLHQLSTPVLERLGRLLDGYEAADRPLLVRCYEILRSRYPEHTTYLTVLAEAYRQDGALQQLEQQYRWLSALSPTEPAYELRLAATLLKLDRPAEAQAILRDVDPTTALRQKHLGLIGMTARALGQHHRAARVLRQALKNDLANPELRFELAMALEGLGRHEKALQEWEWVEFSTVDPKHRLVAKERLARSREER
jgi:tetratricopeptide (TPR) repeat protein